MGTVLEDGDSFIDANEIPDSKSIISVPAHSVDPTPPTLSPSSSLLDALSGRWLFTVLSSSIGPKPAD